MLKMYFMGWLYGVVYQCSFSLCLCGMTVTIFEIKFDIEVLRIQILTNSSPSNDEKKTRKLKRIRIILLIFIVLYFLLNTTNDILRSFFNYGTARLWIVGVYFVVTAIFIIMPSIVYLIYGRRLYKEIKKYSLTSTSGVSNQHIRKVSKLLPLGDPTNSLYR